MWAIEVDKIKDHRLDIEIYESNLSYEDGEEKEINMSRVHEVLEEDVFSEQDFDEELEKVMNEDVPF